jgi:hypothetical protein
MYVRIISCWVKADGFAVHYWLRTRLLQDGAFKENAVVHVDEEHDSEEV